MTNEELLNIWVACGYPRREGEDRLKALRAVADKASDAARHPEAHSAMDGWVLDEYL